MSLKIVKNDTTHHTIVDSNVLGIIELKFVYFKLKNDFIRQELYWKESIPFFIILYIYILKLKEWKKQLNTLKS